MSIEMITGIIAGFCFGLPVLVMLTAGVAWIFDKFTTKRSQKIKNKRKKKRSKK